MSQVLTADEIQRINKTGDFRLPIDEVQIEVGQADRFGKCRVTAKWDGGEHVDKMEPFAAWQRKAFGEMVCVKLSHVDEAGPFTDSVLAIGNKIVAAANNEGPQKITVDFPSVSCRELASTDYREEYLIDEILCARQPCTIGGPRKGLKTWLIIDAALSLATGKPFLGKFPILRGCRSGVMSGESQFSTLQKNARACAAAKGFELDNVDGIVWSDKLPVFGSATHIDGLAEWIKGNELEVIFIDPCYLCMDTQGNEGSIFRMGELLRSISEPCQEMGCTLVVAHHMTKEAARSNDPPELDWLSWSGFAEFSRQWWLLNRRSKYEPGTFRHQLWLSIGGSAGHGSLWAANVFEGSRHDRRWEVELLHPDELNQAEKSAEDESKEAKVRERIDRDKSAILKAVLKLPNKQGTLSAIRARSGRNGQAFSLAFTELVDNGDLQTIEISKGNKRTYEGFKVREDSEP